MATNFTPKNAEIIQKIQSNDICSEKIENDFNELHLNVKRLHQTTKKTPKTPTKIFTCKKCIFECFKQSDFRRHVLTTKHKNNHEIKIIKHQCEVCKKEYTHHSSLWKHKQKCVNITEKKEPIDTNAVMELVKQNQEFKQIMIQQQSQLVELASKSSTIINSNNKTKFNLNFFLNEQCKDALNITDFVNSIKLQLIDLENTGKNGFVDGISQIIIKNLKDLDIYKRPIHCSDIKRETMYVKDKNIWEKENEEKEKLNKTIRQIAHKNIQQIPTWIKEHPKCDDYYSKQNNQYLQIVHESMGGKDGEENAKYYNKIVKNVSKEVVIYD